MTELQFDALVARIEKTAETTRRHFDVTAESLRAAIGQVVEAVTLLDAKVDRRCDALEGAIGRCHASPRRCASHLAMRLPQIPDANTERRYLQGITEH
ncbi:MAG TPA: hypothetical protein VFO89_09985 [Thermoanaerobaculia bacterium]|nr:hypothetical protein [Thermoanaerobaculia bacterium]